MKRHLVLTNSISNLKILVPFKMIKRIDESSDGRTALQYHDGGREYVKEDFKTVENLYVQSEEHIYI